MCDSERRERCGDLQYPVGHHTTSSPQFLEGLNRVSFIPITEALASGAGNHSRDPHRKPTANQRAETASSPPLSRQGGVQNVEIQDSYQLFCLSGTH